MSFIEFKIKETKPVKQVLVKNKDGTEEWEDDPREKIVWLQRSVFINIECIQSVEETYNMNYSKTMKSMCRIVTKDNKVYYAQLNYNKAKNIINNKPECGFKYKNRLW